MKLDDVLAFAPWPQHTNVQFAGREDGHWFVEVDVADSGGNGPRRLKLEFGGVVQARLNHDNDRKVRRGNVFYIVSPSEWYRSFEQAYVSEFGPKLVAVIRNVKHFVIQGQDLSVGILARTVSVELA
jgi:hypothetical protein